MKKLLMAIICFTLVSLISSFPVDAKDTVVTAQSSRQEKIYKINSEFFNSQATDSKRLKLWLRPSYDIESGNEEIIALAKTITASLTDDYAKVKAIHDYVCDNIYYDYVGIAEREEYQKKYMRTETEVYEDGTEVTQYYDLEGRYDDLSVNFQSALAVIKSKKGVCEGYTNLTCALLRAAGIPAQVYKGAAGTGSTWYGHSWSGAYISSENRWIILDTTWDSQNGYSGGKFTDSKTRYTYFDPDLYTFSVDHEVTPPVVFEDIYFAFKNVSMGKYCKDIFWTEYVNNGQVLNFDSYVSSNPKVATVNQEGEVVACDYGITTISYARLDGSGLIDSFKLTVEPQELNRIWGSDLMVGDTQDLTVTAYSSIGPYLDELYEEYEDQHEDDDDYVEFEESVYYKEKITALSKRYSTVSFIFNAMNIKWKSSNTKVLKVDKNGKVTAVGAGKATITATNLESTSSVEAEFEVFSPLTGITLSNKTLTLKPKSEVDTLKIEFSPKTAREPSLRWESSNPKVVEVDEYDGYITALKEGSAIITVSVVEYLNGTEEVVLFTDTCKVTVKAEKKATGVKLNKTTAILTQGNAVTLKATISPTNVSNKTVTWTSSNPKIATVSRNGKVTAKSKGKVTITCKTSNGKTATCKVTVK